MKIFLCFFFGVAALFAVLGVAAAMVISGRESRKEDKYL